MNGPVGDQPVPGRFYSLWLDNWIILASFQIPDSTLTLWSSEYDTVDIDGLMDTLGAVGLRRVYIDVPGGLHCQIFHYDADVWIDRLLTILILQYKKPLVSTTSWSPFFLIGIEVNAAPGDEMAMSRARDTSSTRLSDSITQCNLSECLIWGSVSVDNIQRRPVQPITLSQAVVVLSRSSIHQHRHGIHQLHGRSVSHPYAKNRWTKWRSLIVPFETRYLGSKSLKWSFSISIFFDKSFKNTNWSIKK